MPSATSETNPPIGDGVHVTSLVDWLNADPMLNMTVITVSYVACFFLGLLLPWHRSQQLMQLSFSSLLYIFSSFHK